MNQFQFAAETAALAAALAAETVALAAALALAAETAAALTAESAALAMDSSESVEEDDLVPVSKYVEIWIG